MASGDFLELAQRAARAARFDPSDTTDLTRAKEAINEAYLTSCAVGFAFDFLEREGTWTVTPGTDVYTYAVIASAIGITGAGIAEITSLVNDTDGYKLKSGNWDSLEDDTDSSQDDEASGAPRRWAKWASRIRLFPNPDEAITLGTFMRLVPSEMSLDADTPLIPLQFRHAVLVPHAAANLLRQEGGGEAHNEAQMYQRMHEQAWTNMRTAHATFRKPHGSLKAPGWDAPHESAVLHDPWEWTS